MAEHDRSTDRRNSVGISRWRRQDGFVRGVVFYAAVLVIVGVLVLDAVSVVHASLGVRQNATDAADQALSTFVQTENPDMAMQSASTFLKVHDSILLKSRQHAAALDRRDRRRRRSRSRRPRRPTPTCSTTSRSCPGASGPGSTDLLNPRRPRPTASGRGLATRRARRAWRLTAQPGEAVSQRGVTSRRRRPRAGRDPRESPAPRRAPAGP